MSIYEIQSVEVFYRKQAETPDNGYLSQDAENAMIKMAKIKSTASQFIVVNYTLDETELAECQINFCNILWSCFINS